MLHLIQQSIHFEFMPYFTQLLGCNIAPYFLCNPEQAKSIIYYVTKDKASIAASLTLP